MFFFKPVIVFSELSTRTRCGGHDVNILFIISNFYFIFLLKIIVFYRNLLENSIFCNYIDDHAL